MTEPSQYPVVIWPLDPEDGAGFGAVAPDLPGCTSDGAPPQEALANVQDAIVCWIEAATDMGRPILPPSAYWPWQAQSNCLPDQICDQGRP
ncbi:antitoxin HicB [Bradyrhizobium sp. AZCC 1578]|uniref:type II toxin-antitoxin system HicB family antitoxin n=1 Tax=Bradyrhizobium sp. AZCC 1578 TaxID=3117027 RepID=UPI002FF35956